MAWGASDEFGFAAQDGRMHVHRSARDDVAPDGHRSRALTYRIGPRLPLDRCLGNGESQSDCITRSVQRSRGAPRTLSIWGRARCTLKRHGISCHSAGRFVLQLPFSALFTWLPRCWCGRFQATFWRALLRPSSRHSYIPYVSVAWWMRQQVVNDFDMTARWGREIMRCWCSCSQPLL